MLLLTYAVQALCDLVFILGKIWLKCLEKPNALL